LWDLKALVPMDPFPQYRNPQNRQWQLTQELIKAIQDQTEKRGAGFLLVILPQRNYLNGMYDPFIYHCIVNFAEAEDISYVNLYSAMRFYPWDEVFYPEDGHFTPIGAQITAWEIWQAIRKLGAL
jgi:hypothetical protein